MSAKHVTRTPGGRLHVLVLRTPDHTDVELTVIGEPPERLRYELRFWRISPDTQTEETDPRRRIYRPE